MLRVALVLVVTTALAVASGAQAATPVLVI